jgi:hypothetical protein
MMAMLEHALGKISSLVPLIKPARNCRPQGICRQTKKQHMPPRFALPVAYVCIKGCFLQSLSGIAPPPWS